MVSKILFGVLWVSFGIVAESTQLNLSNINTEKKNLIKNPFLSVFSLFFFFFSSSLGICDQVSWTGNGL